MLLFIFTKSFFGQKCKITPTSYIEGFFVSPKERRFFMSKKKIYNKHLEKGRFYSVNKHPGLIVSKNDKKNIYIAVVTGTTKRKHQTMLTHPTESKVKVSYVNNRPVQGRRKHFGSKVLKGMKIHSEDRMLVKMINKRKPIKLK